MVNTLVYFLEFWGILSKICKNFGLSKISDFEHGVVTNFQDELSGNLSPYSDLISKFSRKWLGSHKSLSICTKIAVMKNISKILGNFVLKTIKMGWVPKKI